MATIPNPELEKRTTPSPGTSIAQADVSGYGAGAVALGEGLRGLSTDAIEIQVAEKNRVDGIRTDDAFNQYKKHLIDLQVGENGYQRVKGDGVMKNNFIDGYKDLSSSKIDELASTLDNEDQKEKFKAQAKNAALGFELDLMNHAVREEEVAGAGVLAGAVDVGVNEAQHNWYDDAKVDAAKLRIIDQAGKFYDDRGKSEDEKKAFIDEAVSQIEAARAYQFIEAEMFDEVDKRMKGWEKNGSGSTIDSDVLLRIQAKLKERKNKTKARTKADEIMSQHETYEDRLRAAKKDPDLKKDTDWYDKVVERLDSENIRESNIKTEEIKNTTDDLTNKIIDAPDLVTALEHADEAEETSGVLRKELRSYAIALKSGGPKHSVLGAREEARARIDGQSFRDPETGDIKGPITDMNRLLIEYAPLLKKTDLDAVVKYMEGGGIAASLTDSEVRSMFKSVTGKEAKDKKAEYALVWEYVSSRAKPNQKLTDDELRKMVIRATMEGEHLKNINPKDMTKTGWSWKDEDMTYAEAEARGIADQWYPGFTSDEKKIIDSQIGQYNIKAAKENEKAMSDKSLSQEQKQRQMKWIIPENDTAWRSWWKKHMLLGIPIPEGE